MLKLRLLPIIEIFWGLLLRAIKTRTFVVLCLMALIIFIQWNIALNIIQKEVATAWTIPVQGDCGIVLTGGPGRIREGIDLLSRGAVKKLIISGVNGASSLPEIFPSWALYPEIHEDQVFLEKRSETTFGNAQQSLPLAEALQCRDVVLITSKIHMPRAYKTFKHVFPSQIEIVKNSLPVSRSRSETLEIWYEAVKTVFYSFWAY